MTPAERAYWARAQRRAAVAQPDIAAAILRAFDIVRDALTDAELELLVRSGSIDRLLAEVFSEAVMDRAFIPLRERIRSAVQQHVKYFVRELPKGGKVDGVLAVTFDYLAPVVIDAVRQLDTKVMQTLKDDARETVRAFVENGLRDGVNPKAVARDLRATVGLAPNQEEAVRNYRRELEDGRSTTARRLRDRRFDGADMTPERIDKAVAAYRRRFVAFHAETVSRTASLDALKLGHRLAWEDAAEKGVVDRARMVKRWSGVLDDRERDAHVAMEGETVPFDQPFSNGQMIPGDDEYNCRCLARYFQR